MPKCPKCNYMWVNHSRSNQQNKYYFGVVLPLIEEHTGHDTEELHEFFKNKYISIRKFDVFGQTLLKTKSTTELSTMEFETYLSKIIMFASRELEIIIPNPDEEKKK